jgi:tetratricopeptide (TPR) repeat protein
MVFSIIRYSMMKNVIYLFLLFCLISLLGGSGRSAAAENGGEVKIIRTSEEIHLEAIQKAKAKDYAASEMLFRQAIQQDNKNPVLLCDFAKLFSDQQKYPDAETILKNALLLQPNHRRVLFNLGWVIAIQKDRETEGLRYLKLALGEAAAYRELAKIYRSQGNAERAEFAEQQATLTKVSFTPSGNGETVLLDANVEKSLIGQIKVELLRLETKELVSESEHREKKEQQNRYLNPVKKIPPQAAPEENAAIVKIMAPVSENEQAVRVLPQIAITPRSESLHRSDIPQQPNPPEGHHGFDALKNSPEYTAIRSPGGLPTALPRTEETQEITKTDSVEKGIRNERTAAVSNDISPQNEPELAVSNSSKGFRSAQAPTVLNFGVFQETPKTETAVPIVAKKSEHFQPPTVLKFGLPDDEEQKRKEALAAKEVKIIKQEPENAEPPQIALIAPIIKKAPEEENPAQPAVKPEDLTTIAAVPAVPTVPIALKEPVLPKEETAAQEVAVAEIAEKTEEKQKTEITVKEEIAVSNDPVSNVSPKSPSFTKPELAVLEPKKAAKDDTIIVIPEQKATFASPHVPTPLPVAEKAPEPSPAFTIVKIDPAKPLAKEKTLEPIVAKKSKPVR